MSIPDFVRGPGQEVNLPADTTLGIPITISDGENVQTVNLSIAYDPSLLSITGAEVAAGIPDGSSVTLDTASRNLTNASPDNSAMPPGRRRSPAGLV